MANEEDKIIGTGWAFPPRFDRNTGSAVMVTGDEDIQQSLRILFGTHQGERILKREYGCDLTAELFQNMNLTQKTDLEQRIRNAVLHYEARIKVNEIDVDVSDALDGILRIQIDYTIATTNSRRNIVFPYFLAEGTLVPKT